MGNGRRHISWFAGSLRIITALSLTTLRAKWDTDLTAPLTDREWELALMSPTNVPRNARLKLIQFYTLHRAYLTPGKINKYFTRTDAACPRCGQSDAELVHVLWSCPTIQLYWDQVLSRLSSCTGREIPRTDTCCLLLTMRRGREFRAMTRFIDLGLLLAKRLLTRGWKAPVPPHIDAWVNSVRAWAQAESTTLHTEELRGLRKFPIAECWDKMLADLEVIHVRSCPTSPIMAAAAPMVGGGTINRNGMSIGIINSPGHPPTHPSRRKEYLLCC